MPKSRSLILFHLDDRVAANARVTAALADAGFLVDADGGSGRVDVRWGGDGEITLHLRRLSEKEVAFVVEDLPRKVVNLDAGYAIEIDDLDAALDEMNTLIEVQAKMQGATTGWIFNEWNGSLSDPQG